MIDPRFEDYSAPEMLRQIVERMQDMEDDSPEQVLYLSQVIPLLRDRNLDDLMSTPAEALGRAHEWLEMN
jgi:hypothetical protein